MLRSGGATDCAAVIGSAQLPLINAQPELPRQSVEPATFKMATIVQRCAGFALTGRLIVAHDVRVMGQ